MASFGDIFINKSPSRKSGTESSAQSGEFWSPAWTRDRKAHTAASRRFTITGMSYEEGLL